MRSSLMIPRDSAAEHVWRLRCDPNPEVEALQPFVALFRDFAALGDAGAFASPESGGAYCRMAVGAIRIAPGLLEAEVDVANCDARYTRLLRNCVFARAETAQVPTSELIVEPGGRSLAVRELRAHVAEPEVVAGTFYPEMPQYQVRIQKTVPPSYHSGRRVWVEAHKALAVETVNDLIERSILWGSVMVTAYPEQEEDLQTGRTMILNVEPGQHDDFTFEVLIDRFLASEAAFVSLMNLLLVRVRRDGPIVAAFIE